MKKRHFGLWAIALCVLTCTNPVLKELDFFGVKIQSLDPEGLNGFRALGQVIAQGSTDLGECGFLWSYDRQQVEQNSADAQWVRMSFPPAGSDGAFETVLDNLTRGQTVWIRAFARATDSDAGERMVFSENIESFTVGEIVALTGIPVVSNNAVLLFGQLRGLEILGKKVDAHGHVVSPTNAEPSLGCSDCLASDRGSSNDDAVYGSQIAGLEFNTDYFVRAYAIAGKDTFYSSRTDTFGVRDGWVRIADFPSTFTESAAAAAVWNGRAYAGFGCQNANGACTGDELELQRDFWSFDPAATGGSGKWTKEKPVLIFDFNRTNAASFAIDNFFYVLFGEFFDSDNDTVPIIVADFSRYNLQTGLWEEADENDPVFDLAFKRRTAAVAFVIDGYAYVGSGRDAGYKELNDFWQYNPATSHWRQVAGMPASAARYEAVAFSAGGYGYVGTGQSGATPLRDFWRFRPPLDDADSGEWTPAAPLPPEAEARWQAVAFTIGEKGYVATGYHPGKGYLGDLWQYDPDSIKWTQKTPFQGVARTNAIGFSLSDKGYLGTGNTKVQLNGGLSSTERSLSDIWRYIPEQ